MTASDLATCQGASCIDHPRNHSQGPPLFQLSHHGTPCMDHFGIPWPALHFGSSCCANTPPAQSTLGYSVLPYQLKLQLSCQSVPCTGHLRTSWVVPHLGSSYPTRAIPAHSTLCHPTPACTPAWLQSLCWDTLCGAPQDPLVCTQFSFSCPDRAFSM